MKKAFNIDCLTKNGIRSNVKPNNTRKTINLVFDSGETVSIAKASPVAEKQGNAFVWKDEVRTLSTSELRLFDFDRARGNPLISTDNVKYMSDVDSDIDDIINFYSE